MAPLQDSDAVFYQKAQWGRMYSFLSPRLFFNTEFEVYLKKKSLKYNIAVKSWNILIQVLLWSLKSWANLGKKMI